MRRSGWIAPAIAAAGLAGLAATFVSQSAAFRSSVAEWARRDLSSRARLAAATLADRVAASDFEAICAFGGKCEADGLRMTLFSNGGGVIYDSRREVLDAEGMMFESAPFAGGSVRLGLSEKRIFAPFERTKGMFALAALAGAAGMAFLFTTLYRQRVKMREMARSEKFTRDFVADVSHEIKTPVTGILGAADLLCEVSGEGDAARLAGMVAKDARRLEALAQGVLDLARLEHSECKISKSACDVASIVRDVVETFSGAAVKSGVELKESVAADPGGGLGAFCDGELVFRALSNLVSNAIRHSGSRDVEISAARSGRSVRLSVEDHGKGIAPGDVARAFSRFGRLDSSRSAADGGAGLGLSIAAKIARLHGGRLELSAAKPSGCVFRFSLPAAPGRFR